VRNFAPRWRSVVVSLLLMPGLASAAGLGSLNVRSAIGQPFSAEIDLVSVEKEDPASLSVRLASPEDYRKANLQFSPVVAALRLSIERRADGRPYIKITSMRPVNEFVVDLLVELSWPSGRILREYRALLDPPVAEPVAAPVSVPTPQPVPAPAPVTRAPAPVVSPRPAMPGSYGPVERGETLSKIARNVMPTGVTLEQMLVGLYWANPEAFVRNNMNLVRTGKILRVPDREQVAAIPRDEALQEYRAQVADWNSYRRRVADAAATTPRETAAAAKGEIAARVDDRAGGETKDVVRLSKGEPPGAKPGEKVASQADRIRSLEEELVAREKALAEANDRIARLEKTIKDMQRLAEIKSSGLAAAQQRAEAVKPEAKPEPKPEAKPEAKTEVPPAATEAQQPKPKPAPTPQAPPLQPREPELMDIVMDNLPLLGGGAAIALGGLGLWLARRRRVQAEEPDAEVRAAPTMAPAESAVPPAAGAAEAAKPQIDTADLDPLEEARVYLSHGREAQAEAILKEAMAREPNRQDIQMKLLELYALRKDKTAFNRLAAEFNRLTGGVGDNWLKVAAMGLALDPENPLFGAGRTEPSVAPQSSDLDFDFDLSPPADEPATAKGKSEEEPISTAAQDSSSVAPAGVEKKPQPEPDSYGIDFQIELPKVAEEKGAESTTAGSRPAVAPDFKLDLSNIDLNLEEKPAEEAGPARDAHWYDVQAKFDLARTYQEMGDRREARHVLEEVLREGDAQQQAQARALLRELG
jgi:pilus assembly protein FimV